MRAQKDYSLIRDEIYIQLAQSLEQLSTVQQGERQETTRSHA